jgi:hypothetical protein
LLFASLFIEESLDVIIEKMNAKKEMNGFFGKQKTENLGLLDKSLWFFNQHLAIQKARNKDELRNFERKIYRRFPGFQRLCQIRNDVAHGKINRRLTLKETEKNRIQAKAIVNDLLAIAKVADCEIPRDITYMAAIESDKEQLSEDRV